MAETGAPFGAYVHIPFCSSRCDYCAFATWTDRHHLIDDYLSAVAAVRERYVGDSVKPSRTRTVNSGSVVKGTESGSREWGCIDGASGM